MHAERYLDHLQKVTDNAATLLQVHLWQVVLPNPGRHAAEFRPQTEQ